MFGGLDKLLLFLILVLPSIIVLTHNDHVFASAEEDEVEGEGEINADEDPVDIDQDMDSDDGTADTETSVTDEEEEDEEAPLKGASEADTTVLFIKPLGGANLELPAGQFAEILVGFTNKGEKDFIIEVLDASFRYPMDYSFYIQNFSTIAYSRSVKPKQQATLYYSFTPAESFAGRPFGLTVNVMYKDIDGNLYQEAVYNETVTVTEVDEGLDGETFFLYLFLTACVVLLLVLGQQFLASLGRKRGSKGPAMEMGTVNANDVDYQWIPKETLMEINKSPRQNTRQSPRQRKTKRSYGSDD